MTTTKVATANRPQRMGGFRNDRVVQSLADRHDSVIACQEVPDSEAARLCPKGYRRHRPGAARSEVIYWDPMTWETLGRGKFQISSDRAPAPRFVVWVLLRHRKTGVVVRFGCVHLVAFKTRNKAHAREFEHQAERVAEWLSRPGNRVAMGDFNGSCKGHWLAPVMKVANCHTPPTNSGPGGQHIDLIVANKAIPRAVRARTVADGDPDHKPVEAELPF